MTVTVMMMMNMFTKQYQTGTIRKQSSEFRISNFFVVESIFVMLQ